MNNKIKDMVELQNTLNVKTNGNDWVSGITDEGKTIRWWLCVNMEASELIDSLPWKHWKAIDSEIDIDNIKIEITDIWHFIMSAVIELTEGDIDEANKIILDAMNAYADEKDSVILFLTTNIITNSTVNKLYILTDYLITGMSNLYRFNKLINEQDANKLVFDFMINMEVISEISDVLGKGEFTLNHLYNLYLGKNVLNEFRQNNGYKEGDYVKIWNGVEDNVIMGRMLEDNLDDLSYGKLYDMLNEYYSQL